VLAREHAAGPAESARHFIGDEQRAVSAAQIARAPNDVLLRNQDTEVDANRLDDERRDVAGGYDSVCDVGADTLGTDTLKEGFAFESIAGPPLRTSISPRTVVGALVVALLKMVTTIRFHGALS